MSEHLQAVENRFAGAYIAAGMPVSDNWYWSANSMVRDLAAKHGIDFNVCAAIVAALSPRIRWQNARGDIYPNLDAADNLITGFCHHKAKAKVFANVAGFNHNKVKAWAILRSGNISILSGPKVTAFYHNIVNPDNDEHVTIDSWMFAVAYGLSFTAAKEDYSPTKKQREIILQALRNVAAQYAISTIDLQAIVWQWAKESSGHWRTM